MNMLTERQSVNANGKNPKPNGILECSITISEVLSRCVLFWKNNRILGERMANRIHGVQDM